MKNEKLEIITNNIPRPLLNIYDVTEKEQEFIKVEFDYIDNFDEFTFFKYQNKFYDLGEFAYIDSNFSDSKLKSWDGYSSDSYFSGIVIKTVGSEYSIIVGRYYL